MQAKAAFSWDSACANAKVLPAIAATVRHRLMIFALIDVAATTMAASWFIAPAVVLEIFAGRFLVWELLKELIEADGSGLPP